MIEDAHLMYFRQVLKLCYIFGDGHSRFSNGDSKPGIVPSEREGKLRRHLDPDDSSVSPSSASHLGSARMARGATTARCTAAMFAMRPARAALPLLRNSSRGHAKPPLTPPCPLLLLFFPRQMINDGFFFQPPARDYFFPFPGSNL